MAHQAQQDQIKMVVQVEQIPVVVVVVAPGMTVLVVQGARVLRSFVTPIHRPLTTTIT
jgi:hypothetical protein